VGETKKVVSFLFYYQYHKIKNRFSQEKNAPQLVTIYLDFKIKLNWIWNKFFSLRVLFFNLREAKLIFSFPWGIKKGGAMCVAHND